MTLPLFLALTTPARASDDATKLRPETFSVDPKLSTGSLSHFRRVYIEPSAISALAPVTAAEGRGTLYVRNNAMAGAELSIGETRIGEVGPLTDVSIQGVKAGTYNIRLAYSNGHVVEQQVAATDIVAAPAPTAQPAEQPTPSAASSTTPSTP